MKLLIGRKITVGKSTCRALCITQCFYDMRARGWERAEAHRPASLKCPLAKKGRSCPKQSGSGNTPKAVSLLHPQALKQESMSTYSRKIKRRIQVQRAVVF